MPACTDNVLISTKVLQRFLSCTDGLEDIFKCVGDSILDNKSLLCQHGSGKVTRAVVLNILMLSYSLLLSFGRHSSEHRSTTEDAHERVLYDHCWYSKEGVRYVH